MIESYRLMLQSTTTKMMCKQNDKISIEFNQLMIIGFVSFSVNGDADNDNYNECTL